MSIALSHDSIESPTMMDINVGSKMIHRLHTLSDGGESARQAVTHPVPNKGIGIILYMERTAIDSPCTVCSVFLYS
jgi:hypothetical protein